MVSTTLVHWCTLVTTQTSFKTLKVTVKEVKRFIFPKMKLKAKREKEIYGLAPLLPLHYN